MKTLDLQIEKDKADFLRRNIDWCQFSTVKRYVDSPTTEIHVALIVDRSIPLEQVAVIAWLGDVPQWKHLIATGLIQSATENIPSDANCHVIYMPPAYLVQLID